MTSKKSRDASAKNRATAEAEMKRVKLAASSRQNRMSILDAAARVLKENGDTMNCKQMVETMLAKKYWKTSGNTPSATLSSAILRELKDKGKESRFRKEGRGLFVLAT